MKAACKHSLFHAHWNTSARERFWWLMLMLMLILVLMPFVAWLELVWRIVDLSLPAIFRQKICNGVDKEIYDIERNHCIVKMGRISLSLALKKAMIPLSIWFYDVINLSLLLLFFFLSSLLLLMLSVLFFPFQLDLFFLFSIHFHARKHFILLPPSVSFTRVAYHFLLNFACFFICIISHVHLSLPFALY